MMPTVLLRPFLLLILCQFCTPFAFSRCAILKHSANGVRSCAISRGAPCKPQRQTGRCIGNVALFPRMQQLSGPATKVVILGGGFGGLYTALYIANLSQLLSQRGKKLEVTLVDSSDRSQRTCTYEIFRGPQWMTHCILVDSMLEPSNITLLIAGLSSSRCCTSW